MTALIVALAVIIPSAALVLIAREYFSYRSARIEADAAHNEAYRQLADQYARLTEQTQVELVELRRGLGVVEDLLRSVD